MKYAWMAAVAALLLATGLTAQIQVGNDPYTTTEVVDSSGTPTNQPAKLSDPGDILVGNGFAVDVVVEIWSSEGELLLRTTVAANNLAFKSPHGLPAGDHEIRACDAGNPPPQPCGTVCVG